MNCQYCLYEIDTDEPDWGFIELFKDMYINFHLECLEVNEEVSVGL